MKRVYLLLLIAGIFAACKKNEKAEPEPEKTIFDGWEEDIPFSQLSQGKKQRVIWLSPNMSYSYFTSGTPITDMEKGEFTLIKTSNPDSCIIRMTPDNGNPVRSLEIKMSADKYAISITEFGNFRRVPPLCTTIP